MAGGQKVTREYLGEMDCPLCHRPAPVRKQANGFAILKCGFCGCTLQTHEHKSSSILASRIKGQPLPVAANEPKPEIKPSAQAAPQPKPAQSGTFW
ncbi:hypothetical protein HQ393_04585 [Chitinibacter bivalviorum]|uniref:Uncharacterized protein n=1 Tax=Chitinibacter bivalviorum TaxID=2739434 RepID=A0A7H9BHA1_9NEIS|nr:hypothetical protein [Chitinibacter bivalviorum]QLG87588.1 hypothetical protein HQ393_04585 [Chitinibacter bivalviorum]